jgi:heme-degrading monooxygenase HmoA
MQTRSFWGSGEPVSVIAHEGVETDQQLQQVRLLGCTEMQGYLLSPARPAAEILQRVVITEWDSLEQAQAFYNSKAWKDDLALKQDKAQKTIRRYFVEVAQ